jgi:protoporphyrinogen oxidase
MSRATRSGLPDCSWYNIPKREKIYQIATKYTKWPQNRPNGRKTYQYLPLQVPLENPKIRFFGLKKMASGNPGPDEFENKIAQNV